MFRGTERLFNTIPASFRNKRQPSTCEAPPGYVLPTFSTGSCVRPLLLLLLFWYLFRNVLLDSTVAVVEFVIIFETRFVEPLNNWTLGEQPGSDALASTTKKDPLLEKVAQTGNVNWLGRKPCVVLANSCCWPCLVKSSARTILCNAISLLLFSLLAPAPLLLALPPLPPLPIPALVPLRTAAVPPFDFPR